MMNVMVHLRSIVCPVDFSEPSRQALRCAAALARRSGSALTVLSAVEPLLAEAATVRIGIDLVKAEIEPALGEFVAETLSGESAPADVRSAVRVGPAADVILEAAAQTTADMIVMGTQGLGGVRKWLLGSTTERVLRRTRTPVLAVPLAVREPGAPGVDVLAPDGRPVLCATDLSDASGAAVTWAASLAQAAGSSLVLLHAVEPIAVTPRWQTYVDTASGDREASARARLQTLIARFAGAATAESVVRAGHAAETIASVADERRPHAIVMGLGGSADVPGAARPGSIAYRVMCLAKVPVLVVPRLAPGEAAASQA
jgi:nucleotide-binding universal stress UspA family protein